ncbi:hypothetical protein PP707_01555 [Acetobacter pasteurianus]|nr:hypothetical protein [Acetobacter pasteurianus]
MYLYLYRGTVGHIIRATPNNISTNTLIKKVEKNYNNQQEQ